MQAEKKKKARVERFGDAKAKPAEDAGELASKLAARAERFALSSKPAPQAAAKTGAPQTAAAKPEAAASRQAQSVEEKNQAALAKAAAMVKPAANPEAEAKRQVIACGFLLQNSLGVYPLLPGCPRCSNMCPITVNSRVTYTSCCDFEAAKSVPNRETSLFTVSLQIRVYCSHVKRPAYKGLMIMTRKGKYARQAVQGRNNGCGVRGFP